MGDWHDSRAESIWQKILETDPQDSIYDANACFRLSTIYEARKENQKAADFLERGMAMSKKTGGAFLMVRSPGDKRPAEEIIREKIEQLRGRAPKK